MTNSGDNPEVLVGLAEELGDRLKTLCTIIAANNLHKDNEYIQAVLDNCDESVRKFNCRREINWVLDDDDDNDPV